MRCASYSVSRFPSLMVKGFPNTLSTCKYLNFVFLSELRPKYAMISSKERIKLLPMENMLSLLQLCSPSRTMILLLYRDRSVRLTRVSRPYMLLMRLNDRSSHFRLVKCPIFSIFSIMLLSSCSVYNLTRASKYWIFRISASVDLYSEMTMLIP